MDKLVKLDAYDLEILVDLLADAVERSRRSHDTREETDDLQNLLDRLKSAQ